MTVSDVLKTFEYLSMGLESVLRDPESEAVPVAANEAHAAQAELKQVVVASQPSSAVPLPGQIVTDD
jgi:hypothetical protein